MYVCEGEREGEVGSVVDSFVQGGADIVQIIVDRKSFSLGWRKVLA